MEWRVLGSDTTFLNRLEVPCLLQKCPRGFLSVEDFIFCFIYICLLRVTEREQAEGEMRESQLCGIAIHSPTLNSLSGKRIKIRTWINKHIIFCVLIFVLIVLKSI